MGKTTLAGLGWRRYRHKWIPRNCRVYVSRDEFTIVMMSPSGYPLRCGRWYFASEDAESQRDELWAPLWELSMKRVCKTKSDPGRHVLVDPEVAAAYPTLLAFLTDTEYDAADGGGRRELGSLSLWAADGLWRAKLNDRDSGYCCYVAGPTLDALLSVAEAACTDPDYGWKPDPTAKSAAKKK